jgi:hypothetical protein
LQPLHGSSSSSSSNRAAAAEHIDKDIFHNKCESLEEGQFAFMCWMNSENRQSTSFDNPILLLKFVNDKQTILYDTDLHSTTK